MTVLGPDFNSNSDVGERPDFLDFLVGDGNAAVGPVAAFSHFAEPSKAIRKPVNHDVAAGTGTAPARLISILRARIGNA